VATRDSGARNADAVVATRIRRLTGDGSPVTDVEQRRIPRDLVTVTGEPRWFALRAPSLAAVNGSFNA
jgi:hypothetical protein